MLTNSKMFSLRGGLVVFLCKDILNSLLQFGNDVIIFKLKISVSLKTHLSVMRITTWLCCYLLILLTCEHTS